MKLKLMEEGYKEDYQASLKYRINNDDDLIVIKKDGKIIDKGMVDYLKDNWDRFEDFKFDGEKYVLEANGHVYTVEKIQGLDESEARYWSDSSILNKASKLTLPIVFAIDELENTKDQTYILSQVIGKVKDLCDDYGIDYDNLLNYYNEIENWSNSDSDIEDIEEAEDSATQVEDIPKKVDYNPMVKPDFKVGKKLKEAYDYIGKDTGEPGRGDKSHMEHIYTVYDCFGEVDTFKTAEEAERYIEEHKDDELYTEEYGCTDGPDFRIEEDDIEVLNKKIVMKDDLV